MAQQSRLRVYSHAYAAYADGDHQQPMRRPPLCDRVIESRRHASVLTFTSLLPMSRSSARLYAMTSTWLLLIAFAFTICLLSPRHLCHLLMLFLPMQPCLHAHGLPCPFTAFLLSQIDAMSPTIL